MIKDSSTMRHGRALRCLLLIAICLECNFATVWGTTSAPPAAAATPNCTAVTHLFEARGISSADIPKDPNNGIVLRFCELPTTGSCCTYNMEMRLAEVSKQQFEKNTKELIGKLSSVLGTRAKKFNEFFTDLLVQSKKEFHSMFKRTYGTIYEENAYVFSDLFGELESYYSRGKANLAVTMDSFFNTLYQKMFKVLNGQYILDDKYLVCVSEHMKELKPFGDVPDKLSVQIKRSFVATRTYAQALATAADVAKTMSNIRSSADCTSTLTKMQQCSACKGFPEKPCANYCVNVMKGCLQHYNALEAEWDNFVSTMEKVSERLLGPFNIVMVVEPINIKISEAIMNFQETGNTISNQVFKGCGEPVLGRSSRSVSPKFIEPQTKEPTRNIPTDDTFDIDETIADDEIFIDRIKRSAEPTKEIQYPVEYSNSEEQAEPKEKRKNKKKQQGNKKNNSDDIEEQNREPMIDKLVKDIRQKVKDSKKFWSNLPYQICNTAEASPTSSDESCWNGNTIEKYSELITQATKTDGFNSPTNSRQSSTVATQLFNLKTAVNNLRNAYNGLDVEWPDQEEPYEGSGLGSGAGIDDEIESGSGSSSIDDILTKIPERPDTPSVRVNTDITSSVNTTGTKAIPGITGDRDSSKDSSGSSKVSEMSLRRALITYLFPIYVAWFGGIISDLL